MPAAVAAPAAIQAGTGLLGGFLGSRAAKKAARVQREEAVRQAEQFGVVQTREAEALKGAAVSSGEQLEQRAGEAAGDVRVLAGMGQEEIRGGAAAANEFLQPYVGAGQESLANLREWMTGEGAKQFTAADMEAYDPGYKFRLDMAQQAAEKGAAAKGGVLGGGFAKALAKQQQGLASSEFGSAHDRFMRQQEARYGRLSGMANMGLQAGGQAGQNLMRSSEAAANMGLRGGEVAGSFNLDAARQKGNWITGAQGDIYQGALNSQRTMADLMTGGAAAEAGGIVGSGNAWTGALSNVGQAAGGVGDYYANKDIMSMWTNPAVARRAAPYGGGYAGG